MAQGNALGENAYESSSRLEKYPTKVGTLNTVRNYVARRFSATN